jgi:hypothetical protein
VVVRCAPEPEPGATTEVVDQEIPGTHDSRDLDPLTAHLWIDDVRLDGAATPGRFGTGDTVLVSMRVTDAPSGSVVKVSILDSGHQEVWADERAVRAKDPRLNFTVTGHRLGEGTYEARVLVGDEVVARRHFEVSSGHA